LAGYDKDGDRAASDDLFSYAAKEDVFHSRSPLCADHEDIDFFLLDELDDFIIFTPRFGDGFDFSSTVV